MTKPTNLPASMATQPAQTTAAGTLYIVATPIGNRADISQRALGILRDSVSLIACEDTRHSRILLQHHAINTPLISLHAHNEAQRCSQLITKLHAGESIALISDAGTPLISDPGQRTVAKVRAEQIKVSPIPGACAAIAALSASGFECQHFSFVGFLPSKGRRRELELQKWLRPATTLILYESTHRIVNLVELLIKLNVSARRIMLAREITKRFETLLEGSAPQILEILQQQPEQRKGEFVVLIEAACKQPKQETTTHSDDACMLGDQSEKLSPEFILPILLQQQLPQRQAIDICCQLTGCKKNYVYSLALKISDKL